MTNKKWKIEYEPPAIPPSLLDSGYSPLLSLVLAIRGITDPAQADQLINDGSTLIHDPFLMKNMDKAVERIHRAILQQDKVVVYGDYDVDGITSTCLLTDFLRSCGLECSPYIPQRNEEGYGLNCTAVEKFHADGVNLIITVDCGITAVSEAKYAQNLGVDVIITDHHECKGNDLPEACAVVDCKQNGDTYPNPYLAGVGVAFKLACACSGDGETMLQRYCDLVAIGTVADVMPLIDENRVFVKKGIEVLRSSPRPGIEAMFTEAHIDKSSLSASSIGFILAPRLNAAGRLGDAITAQELIMCTERSRASLLASELCKLNHLRQDIENKIWKEAAGIVRSEKVTSPIVLASDTWNPGVIGIAASRLADQFSLPTIMIYLNGEIGKGSCRSYGGFNLFEALSACSSHLISFGGHALAAGLNIRKDKIEDFKAALADYYAQNVPEPQPEVTCELMIHDPHILTEENVRSLDLLEPYGSSNPKPVMCLSGVKVESFSNVGGGKHLKIRVSSSDLQFDGIWFSHTSDECDLHIGDLIDIAFTPQLNEFRGVTTVQLSVISLRLHDVYELCENILEDECTFMQAASHFCPDRNDFIRVWRHLGSNFRLGSNIDQLLAGCPKDMTPEMYCICLAVFREAGLLSCRDGVIYGSTYRKPEKKADLESTTLLHRLRNVKPMFSY